MAKVNDILRDDTGDYIIRNGRLVIGESTYQHQEDIIMANPGDYPDDPTTGVGLQSYILDDAPTLSLETETQRQFEMDGMKVLKNTNGKVIAEYK